MQRREQPVEESREGIPRGIPSRILVRIHDIILEESLISGELPKESRNSEAWKNCLEKPIDLSQVKSVEESRAKTLEQNLEEFSLGIIKVKGIPEFLEESLTESFRNLRRNPLRKHQKCLKKSFE